MICKRLSQLLTAILFLAFVVSASADVKQARTSQLDFKGSIGTVMKLFGAEKPTRTVEYVKGNLYRSDTMDKKGQKATNSQIIDLDRDLMINLDHKKKKYTQMTLEEWKEMLERSLSGLMESGQQKDDSQKETPEMDVSFNVDVQTPGETRKILDHETEKVLLILNLEAASTEASSDEQQDTEMQKAGMRMITTNWMAKSIDDNEIADFQQKFAEKVGRDLRQGFADIINKLKDQDPQLAAGLKELEEEKDKLSGLPFQSDTVIESWGSQNKPREEDKEDIPKSMGGLFKKFSKKKDKDENKSNVLLEIHQEITDYEKGALDARLFEIPSNYEQEEVKSYF